MELVLGASSSTFTCQMLNTELETYPPHLMPPGDFPHVNGLRGPSKFLLNLCLKSYKLSRPVEGLEGYRLTL